MCQRQAWSKDLKYVRSESKEIILEKMLLLKNYMSNFVETHETFYLRIAFGFVHMAWENTEISVRQ